MTRPTQVLRRNSRLRRTLSVHEYALLECATGAVRRLLPHAISTGWKEGEWQSAGAHFCDETRRAIRLTIPICRGSHARSIRTTITRLNSDSGSARTLDSREHALAQEIAARAGGLFGRSEVAISPSDAVMYERYFDEMVVAGYLRRRHKLTLNVEAFLMALRRLAEQTYENRAMAFGCVIVPDWRGAHGSSVFPVDFFRSKKFRALSDGFRTAYFITQDGKLVGFGDLSPETSNADSKHWYPEWARGIAAASSEYGGVGVALTRQGDILLFEEGSLRIAYRFGRWQYWNHAHLVELLRSVCRVQNVPPPLVGRVVRGLYRAALDVSFRRSGALFVVLRNVSKLTTIVRRGDSLMDRTRSPVDREFDSILDGESLFSMPRSTLAEIAGLDGAVVVDNKGRFCAYGAVLHVRKSRDARAMEGSRTKAAIAASEVGLALKVSSDGDISAYWRGSTVFVV